MAERRRNIRNGIAIPEGLRQSRQRPFFNRASGRAFEVRAEDGVTEIDLYDEIGFWGVDASSFRRQLRGAGDVRLRIHSPGGDVFDGVTMHNDLRAHRGRVTVEIPGLAASAASIVAMAADEIRISPTGFLMIHNAWSIELGDRHAMAAMGALLAQIDGALAGVYAERTGQTPEEIAALMDAETWLAGEAAVAAGFADDVTELPVPDTAFDLSGFAQVPQAAPRAWQVTEAPPARTVRDLERVLTQDAGLTRSEARVLLRQGWRQEATGTQDADQDADFVAAFVPLLDSMKRGIR